MNILLIESAGFFLYCTLFIYTWRRLNHQEGLAPWTFALLALTVALHGYGTYLNIDSGDAQNLSLFNMFAMTTWVAMLLVLWNLARHQAYSLLLISLPFAAISLLEVAIFEGKAPLELKGKVFDLMHIFAGIGALSVLLLAALQASLVLYLDHGLRHRPANIHRWLGPLQEMERFLVQLLTLGFILMTLALILVLTLPAAAKSAQSLHKIILTLISWVVFASLMFGRHVRGWRGVFAAKWTLFGVFLLLLGYFGSKLVLEFILG